MELKGKNLFEGSIIGLVIVIAIAIAIIGQLGPTAVAPALSSMSDTTNITGYSTWSAQAQSSYTSTAGNISLAWFLVPFIIIIAMVKLVS